MTVPECFGTQHWISCGMTSTHASGDRAVAVAIACTLSLRVAEQGRSENRGGQSCEGPQETVTSASRSSAATVGRLIDPAVLLRFRIAGPSPGCVNPGSLAVPRLAAHDDPPCLHESNGCAEIGAQHAQKFFAVWFLATGNWLSTADWL